MKNRHLVYQKFVYQSLQGEFVYQEFEKFVSQKFVYQLINKQFVYQMGCLLGFIVVCLRL